jgi:excisionase family DNA binding protein
MRLADAPDVLTVEQAAEILAISRGSAYEGCRTGEIPHLRVGRSIRVPRCALQQLLGLTAAGTTPAHGNGAAGGDAAEEGNHDD